MRVFLLARLSSRLGDHGRYLLMKCLLPILTLLLIAGCVDQTNITHTATESSAASDADEYTVLKSPPDDMLDEMQSKFVGVHEEWRNEWRKKTETIGIDGQRTIALLEICLLYTSPSPRDRG